MNKTISILGTGWLGLPLGKKLLDQGYTVKGSTTTKENLKLLSEVGIVPFNIELNEHNIDGDILEFLKDTETLVMAFPPRLRKQPELNYASKIAHCKNDGNSEILHFLYNNQNEWAKGKDLEELNKNLLNVIELKNFNINFDECLKNKEIEDHILSDRIDGVKKFQINATPTIIINNEKFEESLTFKNLKKYLQKMI